MWDFRNVGFWNSLVCNLNQSICKLGGDGGGGSVPDRLVHQGLPCSACSGTEAFVPTGSGTASNIHAPPVGKSIPPNITRRAATTQRHDNERQSAAAVTTQRHDNERQSAAAAVDPTYLSNCQFPFTSGFLGLTQPSISGRINE